MLHFHSPFHSPTPKPNTIRHQPTSTATILPHLVAANEENNAEKLADMEAAAAGVGHKVPQRPKYDVHVPPGNLAMVWIDPEARVQLPKDRNRKIMALLHPKNRHNAIYFCGFFFHEACAHALVLLDRMNGSDMEAYVLLQNLMTFANIGDFRRKEFYALVKHSEECINRFLKRNECVHSPISRPPIEQLILRLIPCLPAASTPSPHL